MQTTMKEFGGGDENTTWGGLGVGEGFYHQLIWF